VGWLLTSPARPIRASHETETDREPRGQAMRGMRLGAGIMMGLLVAGLGLARPAGAQEEAAAAAAQAPGEKLGRGLQNGTLGWTELVARPQAEVQAKGAPGLVKGLLDGVAYGTIRTVTGAAEVATFWLPLPVTYQPPLQDPALSPLDRR
jgi:putative exosortase-associated protein (TIGR04073 family)